MVPAAGRGERFGGEKLLAKWRDRELLGHVLLTLSGARAAGLIQNTVVVHRPEDEGVLALTRAYRAVPVATRRSDGALSDSLRAGIDALRQHATRYDRCAALICLGDQPLVRLDVIKALIDTWLHARTAVRPNYRDSPGEPGHPLLVDRSLWQLVAELRGDSGFAHVLASHAVSVRSISVAGRNPDVDTPADLAMLSPNPAAAPG